MAQSGGNTEFSLDLYIHNKLVALRINCINTGFHDAWNRFRYPQKEKIRKTFNFRPLTLLSPLLKIGSLASPIMTTHVIMYTLQVTGRKTHLKVDFDLFRLYDLILDDNKFWQIVPHH